MRGDTSMAKVLVVDDSAIPRMVLRKILQESGYTVVEAADDTGALAGFQRERPDLVVLDLLLKDASGRDALTRLREIDPGVRVIIATGEADEATERRAHDAGAQAFVAKPFDADQLLESVRT